MRRTPWPSTPAAPDPSARRAWASRSGVRIVVAAAHPPESGRPGGQRHGAVRLPGHGHDLHESSSKAIASAVTMRLRSASMRPGRRRGSKPRQQESAWRRSDREERSQPCPARRARVRCAASRRVPAAAEGPDCDPTHRRHRGPARPRSRERPDEARRAPAHRPARDRASGVGQARMRRAGGGATRGNTQRPTSRDRPRHTGFGPDFGPERPGSGQSRMGRAIGLAPRNAGAAEPEGFRRQFS